jgi:ABC-type multidrug transport system ATPase subunit
VLFQLENVTKSYGRVTALDALSVAAPTGAIGLLGPAGSGKTTMIRALLGAVIVLPAIVALIVSSATHRRLTRTD